MCRASSCAGGAEAAVRQAAEAVNSPRPVVPVAMDLVFARYAELDAPCRFHAEPLSADVLRIRAEQNGALVSPPT